MTPHVHSEDNPTPVLQSHPTNTQQARLPLKRMLVFIGLVGTLIVTLLAYSLNTGLRISERYSPLVDATMELKLAATTAHLMYEEMLSIDRHDDMVMVRKHLETANWYANAMLVGGSNSEGVFFALDDPNLHDKIVNVQFGLVRFSELMDLRWQAHHENRTDNIYSLEFSQVFNDLIAETDSVETSLQKQIHMAQNDFKSTQWGLAIIVIMMTIATSYFFFTFAQKHNANLEDLCDEVDKRIQAEEILLRQATTDPLTNLFNRRYITDVIQDEVLRASRHHNPFCVVLMDIDHFKAVNDTHGHDTGDMVLKSVSRVIEAKLREVDVLARWGGEEFLILLRDTDLAGANLAAEKIRLALQTGEDGAALIVTGSFGIAQAHKNETVRELVHRADKALYAAKSAGRNQVQSA